MTTGAEAVVTAFAESRLLLQQSVAPRLLITNSQSVPAHCLGIGDEGEPRLPLLLPARSLQPIFACLILIFKESLWRDVFRQGDRVCRPQGQRV